VSVAVGRWGAYVASHAMLAVGVAAAVLMVALLAWKAARAVARRHAVRADDALTLAAAAVATVVGASGMYRFFAVVLRLGGRERTLLFAFIEVATVTEAVRAKQNMLEFGTAGQDGAAMWVFAGLSAVLASLDARSFAEAVFRLSVPLVAAWLWHRGVALERRRAVGAVIHWRLTAERVLVRLGVADPSARESSEVAVYRRLTVLAHAAKRVRALRSTGVRAWRVRWLESSSRSGFEEEDSAP
jgi:hypothetical protein